MRLIIIRHGETEDNKKNIYVGHGPGILSHTGKAQAKLVGERLKHFKIDKIYVSDLLRAIDTASEVIKHHPKTEVIYEPLLRERNFGEFEGLPNGTIPKLAQEQNIHKEKVKPKDGESMEDVRARAVKFFKSIINSHKKETILFVSHGGFIYSLLTAILDQSNDKHKDPFPKNTAVTILDIEKDKVEVHTLNCTDHLKAITPNP